MHLISFTIMLELIATSKFSEFRYYLNKYSDATGLSQASITYCDVTENDSISITLKQPIQQIRENIKRSQGIEFIILKVPSIRVTAIVPFLSNVTKEALRYLFAIPNTMSPTTSDGKQLIYKLSLYIT